MLFSACVRSVTPYNSKTQVWLGSAGAGDADEGSPAIIQVRVTGTL